MNTLKTLGGVIVAMLIFFAAMIFGTLPASLLMMIGVPVWICNALAGIMYLILTLLLERYLN